MPERLSEIRQVRFTPAQLELVADEARREGVNVSQYVRDAVFARVLVARAARHELPEVALRQAARHVPKLLALFEASGSGEST